ncbi:ABC transporter permease [Natrinema salifodinae]|uniref:Peptide/nickel transport system permease protein n=1 Tax=Natrinema salifodinae TaxID=1202768 RepID=A0A1I0NJV4_9EURY|nr:ABC transporter permease [Natrinema salifodinae]SEW01594.1 peptide/nickel transport system permease protein [Natrinema salifodinae]
MSVSHAEFDDKTLRERIAAQPRPALRWLAVLLVLLALEVRMVAAGLLRLGNTVRLGIESITTIPAAVAGALTGPGGAVVSTAGYVATWLAILALVAVVLKWLVVPWSLTDRVGISARGQRDAVLEYAIVAAVLGVVTVLLAATPVGGVFDAAVAWLVRRLETVTQLQTLTSRETIPNQGYQTPDGSWEGTFLGLSPAWAWALRVAVVYIYAFALLGWFWRGYQVFREHYREADWTPRDDSVDRLRTHYWGLFGIVVVFMFIVMAIWAPALSPVTAEANLYAPYEHEITYYGEDGVQTITHGDANMATRSQGGEQNVGPLSYDQFDRFAPFGTNQDGKDLFTFVAYGARASLVIGVLATGLMAATATGLALMTAYYKGLLDMVTVLVSDSVISMPRFLVVLLLSVLFMEANHPIATIYDGGILLALIFAATGWPFLWRAVRGPSLQIAQQEWVDAARSYGQRPSATMRKHMSPYIAGYMLVYASLSLGGVIIGVAALSFLGYGIQAPTPEWGRAVNEGQAFIATSSWHIATLPGVLVVLVVTAFNALGDGIRDAIDPESDSGEGAEGAAATGGGG